MSNQRMLSWYFPTNTGRRGRRLAEILGFRNFSGRNNLSNGVPVGCTLGVFLLSQFRHGRRHDMIVCNSARASPKALQILCNSYRSQDFVLWLSQSPCGLPPGACMRGQHLASAADKVMRFQLLHVLYTQKMCHEFL